jgi:hypothetical protein
MHDIAAIFGKLARRSFGTAPGSAAMLFLCVGCISPRAQDSGPINTQAIAGIVEQQDLAVRSAQMFRRADADVSDAASQEAEARYARTAAAYRSYVEAVADAVRARKLTAKNRLEQRAMAAASEAKEFNLFAMQNTDPARRPIGTGSVPVATPEQLVRFGAEAVRAHSREPGEQRSATAEELRATARWPEWRTLH